MQRFMKLGTIGAAAVLALGMVGFAAAEDGPPEPHPGCENAKNPPPGCEENGRPGNPDDGDPGEPGDPGDPGSEESPLAPLVDLCDQVVDELTGNTDPQLEEARQLCDALRGDDAEPEPEPDPEPEPGDPLRELCDAAVDGLTTVSEQLEQARAICDALFGEGGGAPDPEPEPEPEPGPDPMRETCDQFVDELAGQAPELEEARAICDALFGPADDGGDSDPEPEPEPGPQDQIADGCDDAVDTLADSITDELREAKALCDGIRG